MVHNNRKKEFKVNYKMSKIWHHFQKLDRSGEGNTIFFPECVLHCFQKSVFSYFPVTAFLLLHNLALSIFSFKSKIFIYFLMLFLYLPSNVEKLQASLIMQYDRSASLNQECQTHQLSFRKYHRHKSTDKMSAKI